jgi:glycosyltransferase involved in cell wall biosynthesis
MNVLLITEYFPSSSKGEITGGVEARCYYIAKELAKNHSVTIITSYKNSEKRKDSFDGIKILRVGMNHNYSHSGSFFSRLNFAYNAYKIGSKLKNIDLVDGYSFITYLPTYYIGKKLEISKIITYHETWLGEWIKNKGLVTGIFGGLWEWFSLKKDWTKIISVSEFTKKRLEKNGIEKENIIVIPNGVEVSKYQKIKIKKESLPTISCVNRLTPAKRTSDVIKAVAIVKKEVPNIQCKIVGQGEELANLKQLSSDLGLKDNVKFLGFVKKQEDVIKTVKSSHVYCNASVLEGFGITVVEAMACKTPYVISDIEPFKEVTQNGKGGFLFKQNNHED